MSCDFVLVDEIASQLKSDGYSVSINSVVLAKKLLATVHEKRVTSGRRPVTLAASSLYIACRIIGESINQLNVAYAAGIAEVTLRECYKFLMDHLSIVFPREELRNRRVKVATAKARLEKVSQIISNCSKQIKDLKAKAEPDFNEIELMSKIVKDLEAERDSLSLTLETSNSWICPENNLESREVD